MNLLTATRFRLDAVLERISALKAGDSPQEHSGMALDAIEEIFNAYRTGLLKIDEDTDPAVAYNHCGVVTSALFEYTPFLGFLHRSKNASNAFELYSPLLRMARSLIGEDVKLILSSEWDYSPFVYLGVPNLLDFVWVGLPASESSNALLTPLAGHEFGHSLWVREKLENRYSIELDSKIIDEIGRRWDEYRTYYPSVRNPDSLLTDFFGIQSWAVAHDWGISQAEEIFCDFLGLRVFGEAYFHAFAYLLAPGTSDRGTPLYPSLPDRVRHMISAAQAFGVRIPESYSNLFQPVKAVVRSERVFFTEVADVAATSLVDTLIEEVKEIAHNHGLPGISDSNVESAYQAFRLLVPAEGTLSLPEIINAGWRAAHESKLWDMYPQIADKRRVVLNELLLKSAQVLEFNLLTRTP